MIFFHNHAGMHAVWLETGNGFGKDIQNCIFAGAVSQNPGIGGTLIFSADALLFNLCKEGDEAALLGIGDGVILFGVILSHLAITLAPMRLGVISGFVGTIEDFGLFRPGQMNSALFLQAAEAPLKVFNGFTGLKFQFIHNMTLLLFRLRLSRMIIS